MDPNLFHLDWERTFEALVAIIVLSFFVERACALIFESRWYIRVFEDRRVGETAPPETPAKAKKTTKKKTPTKAEDEAAAVAPVALAPTSEDAAQIGRLYPVKEGVAFVLALAVCLGWDFDALSIVLLQERTTLVGAVLTAAVIAGGSKASVKLFHDLMRVRSSAEVERRALKAEASR